MNLIVHLFYNELCFGKSFVYARIVLQMHIFQCLSEKE